MSTSSILLGELYVKRSSVDPSKHSDEFFDLFSVPAYEKREPEILVGSDIGSSKVSVEPGDTLLCRIVPHIRRAWVVSSGGQSRQIASGEWIILRHPDVDPNYLRQLLLSNSFHSKFMSTVAGVGGSLMRARPAHAASIRIPLPPLREQRRIADILDRADNLRVQRHRALVEIDALSDSLVGDLRRKSGDTWDIVSMEDAYWFQEGPGVRKWQFTDEGVKLLNVGNILKSGQLDLARTTKHISNDEASGKYKHFLVDEGDLVIASSGIGIDTDGLLRTRGAFVSAGDLPLCMNTSTIRFKALEGISTLPYLQAWLSSYSFRSQISKLVTGSAQKNFGPSHLKQLSIELPPIDVQKNIETLSRATSGIRSEHESALAKLDELFASLQHRAFQGEL